MCNHKLMAIFWLVVGAIVIVVRTYTVWDIWVVLGGILIAKAILLLLMPGNNSDSKEKESEKPKEEKTEEK